MAEETITIFKVGTEEAVQSIADLRENVKVLKKTLEETQTNTEEGWRKYQSTLEELKVNQNALKDAMYATTGTFDDVAKAARGASESYNSLVHRMAALKEEFRATNDEARRLELGAKIKEVNDQLKEMDALQGNFQRNVGNYAGGIKTAFKDMSVNVDAFRKSLGTLGGGLNGIKDGMEGISKSPFIATIGILVSVAMKLADELKENETAMSAIKSLMASLKPVMDFFSGILEKVSSFLADIISKAAGFIGSSGIFNKIIQGVVGVGNAVLQHIISPFKAVIAAIKVFKEQGVKGIGNAAKAFGQEIKNGYSFKQNFKAGQVVAETFIAGAKSKKKEVNQAGKEVAKEATDGFLTELSRISDEIDRMIADDIAAIDKEWEQGNKVANKLAEERIKTLDKAYAHQLEMNSILVEDEEERASKEYAIQEEANQKKLDLISQFIEDALERNDIDAYLALEQQRADLEVEIEENAVREKERLRKKDLDDAKKKTNAQKALLKSVAAATSDILGSIADMYEADEENSEKNANKVKALRIAAATIDTISGAVGAFMQASATIPPPYGQIIGAVQAAAVTAAGIAQIVQMRNTKVSGTSETTNTPTFSATPAPTIDPQVAQVRSVTTASEEDRLNQMASPQRVYILSSDIEASQNQIKTQVSESSF